MFTEIFDKLLVPLILVFGQLFLNYRFSGAEQIRNDAREEAKANRVEEAAWRSYMDDIMEEHGSAIKFMIEDRDNWQKWRKDIDGKIESILQGQLTQMRSDIIHKAHRYIDNLGCASTEEKNAFDTEYHDYERLCNAHEIENDFVRLLHDQVMQLPGRAH